MTRESQIWQKLSLIQKFNTFLCNFFNSAFFSNRLIFRSFIVYLLNINLHLLVVLSAGAVVWEWADWIKDKFLIIGTILGPQMFNIFIARIVGDILQLQFRQFLLVFIELHMALVSLMNSYCLVHDLGSRIITISEVFESKYLLGFTNFEIDFVCALKDSPFSIWWFPTSHNVRVGRFNTLVYAFIDLIGWSSGLQVSHLKWWFTSTFGMIFSKGA